MICVFLPVILSLVALYILKQNCQLHMCSWLLYLVAFEYICFSLSIMILFFLWSVLCHIKIAPLCFAVVAYICLVYLSLFYLQPFHIFFFSFFFFWWVCLVNNILLDFNILKFNLRASVFWFFLTNLKLL